MTSLILPRDTSAILVVFSYARDGISNDTMKLMIPWMQDIWDTLHDGSFAQYFSQTSFSKHMVIGTSAPSRDTMFVSSVNIDSIGDWFWFKEEYFDDIMEQVDELYDFRDFDITGPHGVPDGKVDMLLFLICNWYAVGGLVSLDFHDYSSDEGVSLLDGAIAFMFNKSYTINGNFYLGGEPRAQYILHHEYAHGLGIPDIDHSGFNNFMHIGTGSFDGVYDGVRGPYNPYWRDILLNWMDAVRIDRPRFNFRMPYWSEGDTCIYILQDSVLNAQQKFYIISHKRTSSFDLQWPSPDSGGLAIFHVRTNCSWSDNPRHKNIDVEIASGLYDWYIDTCSYFTHIPGDCGRTCLSESVSIYVDRPNPAFGLDSFDVKGRCMGIWPSTGAMSINSFFDGITYTNFDDFSNPSSKFYNAQDSQVVWSHLAVRNIHPHNGHIYADLLVNNWYGVLDNSMIWGDTAIDKGYAITGDITVQSGDTLRILPGTTISISRPARTINPAATTPRNRS